MPPNVPGVKRTPLSVGQLPEAEEGRSALKTANALRVSNLENPLPEVTDKVPAAAGQAEITGRESLNRTEQMPSSLPEAEEGRSALKTTNALRVSNLKNPLPEVTDKVPAAAGQAEITGRESLNHTERMPSSLPEAAMSGRQHTDVKEGIRIDAGEGIYIENAGLIILHPFLPQLFAVLGIAAAAELLQPRACPLPDAFPDNGAGNCAGV